MPNDDPLPTGVFAASLTPQTADLRVDHEALAAHCRWLLESGCDGVAPLGSTGEATSFAVDERRELLDRLVESGITPSRLLVGTGSCALTDAITLTRHAVEHGVGGVLMLPPFYYKGVHDDGLYAFLDRLIQTVADARLRIYLYHFPRMAVVSFSNALVARLRDAYPHTVVGMKDSSGDIEHMRSICRDFPGFRLYAGTERLLLPVLEAGGAGCISATTNITARLAGEVHRDWRSGGAKAMQALLTAARQTLESHPFVPGLKGLLARRHENPGWMNLRPPLTPLGERELRKLEERLERTGFRW